MVGEMRVGGNSGVSEVSGNPLWLALHLLVTARSHSCRVFLNQVSGWDVLGSFSR